MEKSISREEKNMKCIYCQGIMKKDKSPYPIDRKGYHLLLDAIPAWICQQCGEAYFEEAEVQKIQDVTRTLDKEASRLDKTA